MISAASHLPRRAGSGKTYSVGTLVYTSSALFTVFFWMLWGDLFLQIMESVPAIIPLQLKALGGGDKVVGLIYGSIPAIVGTLVSPFRRGPGWIRNVVEQIRKMGIERDSSSR